MINASRTGLLKLLCVSGDLVKMLIQTQQVWVGTEMQHF